MFRREMFSLSLAKGRKGTWKAPAALICELLEERVALSAPTSANPLQATVISTSEVELRWSNSSGEDFSSVWVWSTDHWVHITSLARDVTSVRLSGLSPGTWFFIVGSHNAEGTTWSDYRQVDIPSTLSRPTSPNPLRLVAVSSTRVDLAWSNASGEDSYPVWRWGGDRWIYLTSTPRDVTNLTVTNLPAGSVEHFIVGACNTLGCTWGDPASVQMPSLASGYHKPLDTFPSTGGYRGFGWREGNSYHNGADYASFVGANVYAVADGTVVYSGQYNGFGSLNPSTRGGVIVVRHTNKSGQAFYAVYGHVNRFVGVGATVRKGEVIGTVAASYNSGVFLPHLHFGIYTGSVFPTSGWGYSSSLAGWVEPRSYLDANM